MEQTLESWVDVQAHRPYGALRSDAWKFRDGSAGAFIITTGYGDGTYTIEARTEKDAWGHDRVVEIRIRFIDEAPASP